MFGRQQKKVEEEDSDEEFDERVVVGPISPSSNMITSDDTMSRGFGRGGKKADANRHTLVMRKGTFNLHKQTKKANTAAKKHMKRKFWDMRMLKGKKKNDDMTLSRRKKVLVSFDESEFHSFG